MTDSTDYPAVDGRPVHEGHAASAAYRVDVFDVDTRAWVTGPAWDDVDGATDAARRTALTGAWAARVVYAPTGAVYGTFYGGA